MHQLHGGVHVHRGAGEVVVLADANDIGILELLVEQGIGVSAVAVVGGPMFCRVREARKKPMRSGDSSSGQRDQTHQSQKMSNALHRKTPQVEYVTDSPFTRTDRISEMISGMLSLLGPIPLNTLIFSKVQVACEGSITKSAGSTCK